MISLIAISLCLYRGAIGTNSPISSPTPTPASSPHLPQPTPQPTIKPTSLPTLEPTIEPTSLPTLEPATHNPTVQPTIPTTEPTDIPTEAPTNNPTHLPTMPTSVPSFPTEFPTQVPSTDPTWIPTSIPSFEPTQIPSMQPTIIPTAVPSLLYVEYTNFDIMTADMLEANVTLQNMFANNTHHAIADNAPVIDRHAFYVTQHDVFGTLTLEYSLIVFSTPEDMEYLEFNIGSNGDSIAMGIQNKIVYNFLGGVEDDAFSVRIYQNSGIVQTSNDWIYITIGASVIVCIILVFLRNRSALKRQLSVFTEGLTISNGLLVSISIGEYQEWQDVDTNNLAGEIYGTFPDLPLENDLKKLHELSKFMGYKFMSNDDKLYWGKQELTTFLRRDVLNELLDADDEVKYDGLIVCVSCHGVKDHIVTSDYKLIEKVVIHRLISTDHPQIREIPRIFIFDSCDGSGDREYTQTVFSDTVNDTDAEKGFSKRMVQILDTVRHNVEVQEQYAVFEVMRGVAQNLLKEDEKYRTLYIDKDLIQKKILDHNGGLDFLKEIGFKEGTDQNKMVCERVDSRYVQHVIGALNAELERLKEGMNGSSAPMTATHEVAKGPSVDMEIVDALMECHDPKAARMTLDDLEREKEWTTSTKNPDFNLVTMHAANSGFVAKTDSDHGSFLIYLFVEQIKAYALDKSGKGLAMLMEEVQNVLHDQGKSQTVNTFNNNTRSLRMRINERAIADKTD